MMLVPLELVQILWREDIIQPRYLSESALFPPSTAIWVALKYNGGFGFGSKEFSVATPITDLTRHEI